MWPHSSHILHICRVSTMWTPARSTAFALYSKSLSCPWVCLSHTCYRQGNVSEFGEQRLGRALGFLKAFSPFGVLVCDRRGAHKSLKCPWSFDDPFHLSHLLSIGQRDHVLGLNIQTCFSLFTWPGHRFSKSFYSLPAVDPTFKSFLFSHTLL